MKKSHFVLLFMVLVLLLASWSPAEAAPVTPLAKKVTGPSIEISNKTGQKVTVRLTGAGYYTVDAIKAKTVLPVGEGTYNYSYFACGVTKTGTIKVTAKKPGKLVINKCIVPKSTVLTVVNMTTGTVYWNLKGPANYNLVLPVGRTKVTLLQGTYTYTVSHSCGGAAQTGKAKFKKAKDTWVWYCVKR